MHTQVKISIEEEPEDLTLQGPAPPANPRWGLRAGVAVAALLVLAVVVGLVLQGVLFKPTCQEPGAESTIQKVNMTCRLKEQSPEGECNIFMAQKYATFLIYGQVKLLGDGGGGEDLVFLEYRWKERITRLQTKSSCRAEVIFVAEVNLHQGSTVYLMFNDGQNSYADMLFHVYEL